MQKVCTVCKELKPFDDFYNRKDVKDGKQSQCKSCHDKSVKEKLFNKKLKAIEYKGGACVSCGLVDHHCVYAFHHRDPTEKDCDWKKLRQRPWGKIVTELDKCDLLCHNCHHKYHCGVDYTDGSALVHTL